MAGRGRLSSIDLLPDEAQDDVTWACQQLAERKLTQADILFELNDRLEAKGIEGISKSAFNRKAVFLAEANGRMAEARELFKGAYGKLSAQDVDESTIALGEFLKTLIVELVSNRSGQKDPKQAMELARAFHATVSAMKVSTDRRLKLEAEMKEKLVKAAETAIEQVSTAGHQVDAASVLKMIREAYGVDA